MSLIGKINAKIEPILEQMGIELVEATLFKKGGRLNLYMAIDKPGGIVLDDLEQANRVIGSILDQEDWISEPYDLEVSSPGIERPLTKPEHFEKFIGSKAKVKAKEPIDGSRNFTGVIKGIKGLGVLLQTDSKEVFIKHKNIAKARLQVDIKF